MYIIKNKNTQKEKRWEKYPSLHKTKLEGFDYVNNQMFIVVEGDKPVYDNLTHRLSKTETFTDDFDANYFNLIKTFDEEAQAEVETKDYFMKICNITFETEPLANEIIIENMNNHIGTYLDNAYIPATRIKHIREAYNLEKLPTLTTEQQSRYNHITAKLNWLDTCREAQDVKILQLIENGEIPAFDWDEMPQ